MADPTAAAPLLGRAEAAASVLPPLLVAAERVAVTVAPGIHGRRRSGPGDQFWQYRRYQPGDSVTQIDWRQSARSDPLYVREREWSAAQTVLVWADRSASMDFRSAATLPLKHERAALLAVALAALLNRGGERLGLLMPGAPPPGMGHAALARLAEALERSPVGEGAHWPTLAENVPLSRHGSVVLFGDFLDPPDRLEPTLRALAGRGLRGHLLQVVDPAEESLPFRGRIRFTGAEGEGDLLIARTEDVRDAYVRRFQAQRAAVQSLARSLDWSFAVHHTDQPPQTALLALHARLAEVR
ncbi:DUF58 domain-containing protein [Caenispirillum bisanense]|uniref:DUF58 domain-containing protein n=1 Tax=Caenispirillum bisanense TaxID=414052 RepID=A0A286GKL7_9PROT|nr:DUF58 domain-containing protein [Caenispirillum bisanense]SOD96078.1 Protein of unknown function DUF58 [Caenispirillum bisanense]